MDPDLRSFLTLAGVMAAAGVALSIAMASPAWLVGAFFLTAVVGLVSLVRHVDREE